MLHGLRWPADSSSRMIPGHEVSRSSLCRPCHGLFRRADTRRPDPARQAFTEPAGDFRRGSRPSARSTNRRATPDRCRARLRTHGRPAHGNGGRKAGNGVRRCDTGKKRARTGRRQRHVFSVFRVHRRRLSWSEECVATPARVSIRAGTGVRRRYGLASVDLLAGGRFCAGRRSLCRLWHCCPGWR